MTDSAQDPFSGIESLRAALDEELSKGEPDPAEVAMIVFKSAMVQAHVALDMHPDAPNFLCGNLVNEGATDPLHAMMTVEVRYQGGKSPADRIGELERENKALRAAWEDRQAMSEEPVIQPGSGGDPIA